MKIYLATPYTSPNCFIEAVRFKKVSKKAGELIKLGYIVFSPISHSHPIALEHASMPRNAKFWMKQSREFIKWCDVVCVLKLEGWKDSVGVSAEMSLAEEFGKRIHFIKE